MKQHHLCGTRIYNIRKYMLKRCRNKNNKAYPQYGGRGIKVCEEWANAQNGAVNFYNWAMANGYRDDLTIDRIDVNGDYCPQNCRWVTRQVQAWNKRPLKNKTGFTGVHLTTGKKYGAVITCDGKVRYIGTYDTAEESASSSVTHDRG